MFEVMQRDVCVPITLLTFNYV